MDESDILNKDEPEPRTTRDSGVHISPQQSYTGTPPSEDSSPPIDSGVESPSIQIGPTVIDNTNNAPSTSLDACNCTKQKRRKRQSPRPRRMSDDEDDIEESKQQKCNHHSDDIQSSCSDEGSDRNRPITPEPKTDSDDGLPELISDNEATANNQENAAESDTEKSPTSCPSIEQLSKLRPAGNWTPIKAVKNREFGHSANRALANQEWFRYKACGSQYAVERMSCMLKLRKHEGCVNSLHFNSTGTKLCSGSDDTNIVIWDWLNKKDLLTFDSGHSMNIFQTKFMPSSGDCHIVTCGRDGLVRLCEISNTGVCKGTRKLAKHNQSAHKLSLEGNSPHVFLSCGEDAAVFQIDLREPQPNKLMFCYNNNGRRVPLYSIHSHPLDPVYFAISGRDSYCRIYDKRMIGDDYEFNRPLKSFSPHNLTDADFKPHVTACVYNHNGTELLGTYNDDDVYVFNTSHSDGADATHRFTGHRNNQTIKGVNWYGPNSEFVVSGSDCGYIYFWERKSQQIVHFAPADEGGVVNVLEPHPTCAALATSGLDNDVKIWLPLLDNDEYTFDAEQLHQLMKENLRQRERERIHPDPDADFIYYMLRQIVRRRRRARRAARGEQPSSDTTSDDGDAQMDTSDSDQDTQQDRSVHACRTS